MRACEWALCERERSRPSASAWPPSSANSRLSERPHLLPLSLSLTHTHTYTYTHTHTHTFHPLSLSHTATASEREREVAAERLRLATELRELKVRVPN